MIDALKNADSRNIKLSELNDKELNALYLRLFSSEDGEMVLQDLANRCFIYDTTVLGNDQFNAHCEGMRALYLSIQTRLMSAVAKKEEVEK